MSFPARHGAASGGPARLTVVEPSHLSADRTRRTGSNPAAELPGLEPFVVEVQRRRLVTIVRPRGELDLATVETLRTTLDAAIAALGGTEDDARLVLDLRSLSFMDSTGLHLLVALDERAQRDGFQLTMYAPATPMDRAIHLCGLDRTLPFAPPVDAVEASG
jgi:anti-sigma B factor antagonist